MLDFAKLFSSIPSWDIIIIIGGVAVIFFYGWNIGKNRLFAALLSMYLSYILVLSLPWDKITFIKIKPVDLPNYQVFIFLAIAIAMLFLLPRSGLGASLRLYKRIQGRWYEILIFSVLQVGLLICLIASFLPIKLLNGIHPMLVKYFTSEELKFWWLFLPIVALILVGRRRDDD